MIPIKTFVVTHKEIEWEIPIAHKLVAVGSFKTECAISSANFVSSEMTSDRSTAFFRYLPAVLHEIKNFSDETPISVVNHRTIWKKELVRGVCPALFEHEIRKPITPFELSQSWEKSCLTEFPDEIDLIVSNPAKLGASVMEQYANAHHIDDILMGFGLAIRMGLISEENAKRVLLKPIAVHMIIARKDRASRIMEKLWYFTEAFFEKHRVKRSGYQERAVNFVVERLSWALHLIELARPGAKVASGRFFVIDPEGVYRPGT